MSTKKGVNMSKDVKKSDKKKEEYDVEGIISIDDKKKDDVDLGKEDYDGLDDDDDLDFDDFEFDDGGD